MKNSSSTIKKVSLNLVEMLHLLFFLMLNIKKAIDGFIMAKFRNAGQTCISANRLLFMTMFLTVLFRAFD